MIKDILIRAINILVYVLVVTGFSYFLYTAVTNEGNCPEGMRTDFHLIQDECVPK